MNKTLVVVGAGPKALAIHTKAYVLREHHHEAPNVVIIEKEHIGANWDGTAGYTDGARPLVTPPEKDLGFPYRSDFGVAVDLAMARYSWHAFQISKRRLADWVDDGKPLATHAGLAEYLRWVADRSSADIRHGTVLEKGIVRDRDEWIVGYKPSRSKESNELRVSGVVMTGPGEPRKLLGRQEDHFNISDSQTFWAPRRIQDFMQLGNGTIAVVGGGDTAASVISTLLDILPSGVDIHYFSKGPIVTASKIINGTRWYTDPVGWQRQGLDYRKKFITATEQGINEDLAQRIATASNAHHMSGPVIDAVMNGKTVRLSVRVNGRTKQVGTPYKRVVVATGFRRWTFQQLFYDQEQFPFLFKKHHPGDLDSVKDEMLSRRVRSDLSYDAWPRPKLYLPGLAGLNVGPGFPSLRCLGLLADRIIGSHLESLR